MRTVQRYRGCCVGVLVVLVLWVLVVRMVLVSRTLMLWRMLEVLIRQKGSIIDHRCEHVDC